MKGPKFAKLLIASNRERTGAKHVFTWRQTSEFQVSNFEFFLLIIRWYGAKRQLLSHAKLFFLFLWCISRQAKTSFLLIRIIFPFRSLEKKNFTFLGGKTSKFDTWNLDVWLHVETCFACLRSWVDGINGISVSIDDCKVQLL